MIMRKIPLFFFTKVFGHLKRLGYVVHRFDPR